MQDITSMEAIDRCQDSSTQDYQQELIVTENSGLIINNVISWILYYLVLDKLIRVSEGNNFL